MGFPIPKVYRGADAMEPPPGNVEGEALRKPRVGMPVAEHEVDPLVPCRVDR